MTSRSRRRSAQRLPRQRSMHQAALPCRSACTQPSRCAPGGSFAVRGAAEAECEAESCEAHVQAAGELRRQLAAEAGAREAAERRAAKLQDEASQAVDLRARLKSLEDSLQARAYQGRLSAGGHRDTWLCLADKVRLHRRAALVRHRQMQGPSSALRPWNSSLPSGKNERLRCALMGQKRRGRCIAFMGTVSVWTPSNSQAQDAGQRRGRGSRGRGGGPADAPGQGQAAGAGFQGARHRGCGRARCGAGGADCFAAAPAGAQMMCTIISPSACGKLVPF